MRHTMKQPAQGSSLQRPTKRDPLPIELDRKNQSNEKQGRPAKERELSVACRTLFRSKSKQRDESEERWNGKRCRYQAEHSAARMRGANDIVNEEEMKRRSQRRARPNRALASKLAMKNKW